MYTRVRSSSIKDKGNFRVKSVLMAATAPNPSDPAGKFDYDQAEALQWVKMMGVGALFQAVVKDLVVEKPDNPINFMINKLKGMTEEDYMPPPTPSEEMLAYDSGDSMGGGDGEMEPEQLQDRILDMFLAADDDGNGYLDRKEFKRVLKEADLGLGKKDIRNVMAECDENEDGVIEYKEFMPIMVDLIHASQARDEAAWQAEMDAMDAEFEAEDFFLRGMSQADLEALMASIFKENDADGNGVLDRKEFKACLKSADLGLTKKEINMLLSEADENDDGVVTYEEFVPMCFQILVEKFKQDYLSNKALSEAGELERVMLEAFSNSPAYTGEFKMSRKEVKKVLEEMSYDLLGLSRVQIVSVMSLADADGQNNIDVPKFVRAAAQMIFKLVDLSAQKEKAAAIANLSNTDGAYMLHGMSGDQIKEALQGAFQEADTEGKGYLFPDQVYDVLQMMGTGDLGLSDQEINGLLAAVDENDDGVVEWEELVDFMYDVLMHLDRDQMVTEIADENAEEEAREPELEPEQLQEQILDMFLAADDDGNGYLDRKEFKRVLKEADLGLGKKDIRNVMAECDENEDGVIEYKEFMPIMVDLIHAAQARDKAAFEAEMDAMDAEFEANDYFIHGMGREQLESLMMDLFKQHDADGNGVLDRKEFKACLKSADLGLTKKEINMLLSEADENEDGVVTYEEFTPMCFQILVEKYKEDYLNNKALSEAGELESYMLQYFEGSDKLAGDSGMKMKRKDVKKVMEAMSYDFLGLSRVQIVSVMSLADGDGKGMVEVPVFVKAASGMVNKLMDLSAQKEKAQAIANLSNTVGADILHGMSGEQVKGMLREAFQEADTEGKGYLFPDQVYDLMQTMGTGDLGLSGVEINSMLAAVDENDDGVVEWEELVDFVWDVLLHLDRDQVVTEIAEDTADILDDE
jgi:Ca2+-binding EF-hand superfamily protein